MSCRCSQTYATMTYIQKEAVEYCQILFLEVFSKKSYEMIHSFITVDALNERLTNNMVGHLDIEYTAIGKDFLSGKMPVNEKTKQPMGLLHGGASVVLAETLGSVAANCCVDPDQEYCVGLEINANHLKSVTQGFVYGTAKAIHVGKRTHVWEILIKDDNNDLVCISRLTVSVLKKKL